MSTGVAVFRLPASVGEIARFLGQNIDDDRILSGAAPLHNAGPDQLTFYTGRSEEALHGVRAGVVLAGFPANVDGLHVIVHENPRAAFARVLHRFCPEAQPAPGIHPTASIDPTASIHPNATIESYAVIGAAAQIGERAWIQAHAFVGPRAVIGEGSRIFPHAVIMDGCVLGARVRVLPGAVLGSDGFGHAPTADQPVRFPHFGGVRIEDDVEIGANSCVDRGVFGDTHIGAGSRIDNLVQVAHGVRLGANCLLAAFSGVAGGATLGKRVVMAGRAAVVNGIRVGDGAVFAGLASASKDVPAGRRLGGSPARNYQQWLREFASLRQLPATLREIDSLKKRLAHVEQKTLEEDSS